MSDIEERIHEIATKQCENYPNIENCGSLEQLYAIESSLIGTRWACKDWLNVVRCIQERYNIENEEIEEFFDIVSGNNYAGD